MDGFCYCRADMVSSVARSRLTQTCPVVSSVWRRTSCPAKTGGADIRKTKRGNATELILIVDGDGHPLAIDITSASPAEVNRIEPWHDRAIAHVPERLVYDRTGHGDQLRTRLALRDVELISPDRSGRTHPKTQDGRPLRNFTRRCIVDRSIA